MNHETPGGQEPELYPLVTRPKAVCAWCRVVLRKGLEPPSHGICDPCICRLCGLTPTELALQRRAWAKEERP